MQKATQARQSDPHSMASSSAGSLYMLVKVSAIVVNLVCCAHTTHQLPLQAAAQSCWHCA
jgi:hypothetical protein